MFWCKKSKNEFISIHNGSGALGYNGLGANILEKILICLRILPLSFFEDITTKTVQLHRIPGAKVEYYRRFRLIGQRRQRIKFLSALSPFDLLELVFGRYKIVGTLNSIGLMGPPASEVIRQIRTLPKKIRAKIIMSVTGTRTEIKTIAKLATELDIKGFEFNPSCPNVHQDLTIFEIAECCNILAENNKSVRLKLSPTINLSSAALLAAMVKDFVTEITINSLPFERIFPIHCNPLAKYGGGGVSGKITQPVTWQFAKDLSITTDIPIIWPGIWDFVDVNYAVSHGAKKISLSSIILVRPLTAIRIIKLTYSQKRPQ